MSDDAQTSKKSSCGVCYTAANNAVRVAAASSRDDFATLTMQCHHNALLKTHTTKKNHMAAATTLARLSTAAALDRHDTVANMMHDRVCPMLSSALELGKEKSDRPAAQRAHAVRDICSSLC